MDCNSSHKEEGENNVNIDDKNSQKSNSLID